MNLRGKGLTQEIKGHGGSIWLAPGFSQWGKSLKNTPVYVIERNNKYAAIDGSSLQHLWELAGIDQSANKRHQFCQTEFRFRSNWPCSVGMTCLVKVRQNKGAPFVDWLNHVTNSGR